jgi:hypothetical protein
MGKKPKALFTPCSIDSVQNLKRENQYQSSKSMLHSIVKVKSRKARGSRSSSPGGQKWEVWYRGFYFFLLDL